MPQDLHVVKCYKCDTYQVDIVKKVKKWSCKMCGEKQSLTKVYGSGLGKDCRTLVQHLNTLRICKSENNVIFNDERRDLSRSLEHNQKESCVDLVVATSKWTEFLPNDFQNSENTFDDSKEKLYKSVNKNVSDINVDNSNEHKTSLNKINYFEAHNQFINPPVCYVDSDEDTDKFHVKKKQKLQELDFKYDQNIEQCEIKINNHSKWAEFIPGASNYDNSEKRMTSRNKFNELHPVGLSNKVESTYTNIEDVEKNDVKFQDKFVSNRNISNMFENEENDIDCILDF